ncbi:HD-GYP domain-containing protein [Tautonia plasticadhaerens]|uniref:Cyclic di-GMP phosphodiesterase response regulator RpfG n=1 Tax=Tautonia plasticadhaerens TaxID=2527974 RepID=A0A518HDY5_9BACT|nr:HD domain-containing phosphohydrolase [Tautonia plasticadhaerens]QDV39053.1 Cyclic di-GMP phosphodiesterase response regulator RpfG [Tautonia plasticadhaerens]
MERPEVILIADDEDAGRKAIESAITGQGYEILRARDGLEALELSAEREPDLALVDVMMPQMDGIEVCRRFRSDRRLRELPLLLVTALDDRSIRLAGLEAGADDFLGKPIDRAEVRTRVRGILRLNRFRKIRDSHARLAAAYDETLEGWASLLDLRDRETEGHSRRVTGLTVALASGAGISGEELDHVRRGALLHDIGKMGIPDAILQKPGRLDPEEWELMKQHPRLAFEMLSGIDFLLPALEIPRWHHERFDGGGYPDGLAGPRIPLAARLFAVVDVWDALSNDRVYRRAWPRDRVLAHLRAESGRHFDPGAVDRFLRMEADGLVDRVAREAQDSPLRAGRAGGDLRSPTSAFPGVLPQPGPAVATGGGPTDAPGRPGRCELPVIPAAIAVG